MKTIILIVAILLSFISVIEVIEYRRKSVNRVSILPVFALLAWAAYIFLKFNIETL